MSRAKALRNSINISRARANTLSKKIVKLLDREDTRIRILYDRIVKDAVARSTENIRLSVLAGELARETNDFTAFNDGMHNVCRSEDNVICGNSCCPRRFPVCGGTNDCPLGKCCNHREDRFALTRSHTNVSALFGVKHFVRPALNFTTSNQNAYFRFIHAKLESLNNTMLLLGIAKNRSIYATTRNERTISSFRVALKQDLKTVVNYKSLIEEGRKKIKSLKDKIIFFQTH